MSTILKHDKQQRKKTEIERERDRFRRFDWRVNYVLHFYENMDFRNVILQTELDVGQSSPVYTRICFHLKKNLSILLFFIREKTWDSW